MVSLAVASGLLLSATGVVLAGQRLLAGKYFHQAFSAYQQGAAADRVQPLLTAAVTLDSHTDLYWQNLSQIYLAQVKGLIANPSASSTVNQNQLANLLDRAVQGARRATVINPRDSQNWLNLGVIYEQLIGGAQGAAAFALEAYQRALQEEPNNPAIMTALGRTNLASADILRAGDKAASDRQYAAAADNLKQAIAAKADYAPALFLLAEVLDRQGKTEAAVAEADQLNALPVSDPAILYQLGLWHYQADRLDRARISLQKAVNFFPTYSNARYYLGLIYDRQGQRRRAIEQFEAVVKINPANSDVQTILNNLRAGQPALGKNKNKKIKS